MYMDLLVISEKDGLVWGFVFGLRERTRMPPLKFPQLPQRLSSCRFKNRRQLDKSLSGEALGFSAWFGTRNMGNP